MRRVLAVGADDVVVALHDLRPDDDEAVAVRSCIEIHLRLRGLDVSVCRNDDERHGRRLREIRRAVHRVRPDVRPGAERGRRAGDGGERDEHAHRPDEPTT